MIPNVVFDTCVAAEVTPRLLLLYLALRSFVWRDTATGDPRIRKMLKAGKLVAKIGQKKLGAMVGVLRQAANALIHEMTALGWVEIARLGDHHAHGYVLGGLDRDKKERFFFDDWVRGRCAASLDPASLVQERAPIPVRIVGQALSCGTDTPLSAERDRKNRKQVERKKDANVDGADKRLHQTAPPVEKRSTESDPIARSPRAKATRSTRSVTVSTDPTDVFVRFESGWDRKHERPFRTLSATLAGKVRVGLEALVSRVGRAEAARAVDAVFNAEWVNDPISLLTRRDLYERLVVPMMKKAQPRGEQSEWSGPRKARSESRTMTATEFFRRKDNG
jgi:hypothetical protein